jgi:hypothetical protein
MVQCGLADSVEKLALPTRFSRVTGGRTDAAAARNQTASVLGADPNRREWRSGAHARRMNQRISQQQPGLPLCMLKGHQQLAAPDAV